MAKNLNIVRAKPAHMGSGYSTKPELVHLVLWISNALARLPIRWGRYSVQRAPLSTNGERIGNYQPKFEGGKVVAAVVVPPEAYRELHREQNRTEHG